jgi:hypothetical protein
MLMSRFIMILKRRGALREAHRRFAFPQGRYAELNVYLFVNPVLLREFR